MKIRIWFSKVLIKYPYASWLLGLLLPFLYICILLYSKKIFNQFKKKDNIIAFFTLILGFQIVSVIFSVFYPFFSIGRLAAIVHNIAAYCFIFFGYILFFDSRIREYAKRNITKAFYAIALIILIGVIYTYITKKGSIIITIPNLLGINSKFFKVVLSFPAWHFMPDFPRTRVMSIYPNGSGLTILLLFSIYMNFNYHKNRLFQLMTFVVFLLCIFASGSRSFLVLAVFLLIVYFINSKKRLWLLTLLIPIIVFLSFPLIDYLISGRKGSNDMRSLIYLNSFMYMLETNPFFGLGLKPIIPSLADKYPLGSHSTPWGYFIKCGLVGGSVVAIAYITVFLKYIMYIFNLVFSDKKLNPEYLFTFSSFVVILIASFFEDLDAFEIIPFYFGILIWQFYRNRHHEYI